MARRTKAQRPIDKWPMADMSPGAAEERIRKHPAPEFDAQKTGRKALEATAALARDICYGLSWWGSLA